jgi:hypothetical protein
MQAIPLSEPMAEVFDLRAGECVGARCFRFHGENFTRVGSRGVGRWGLLRPDASRWGFAKPMKSLFGEPLLSPCAHAL